MRDLARQKLCELITTYGVSVSDEPGRCEGLLRDLCGANRREVFVLMSALREQVVDDLRGARAVGPLLLARLAQRLHDNLGIEEETARWAVGSWALALGLATAEALEPPPPPAPLPAPPVVAPPTVDPFAAWNRPPPTPVAPKVPPLPGSAAARHLQQRHHRAIVTACILLASGIAGALLVVLAVREGTFDLWPMKPWDATYLPATFPHADRITAVAFASDGKSLVTASADGVVKVWSEGQEKRSFHGPKGLSCMALAPGDKELALGTIFGGVQLWNARRGDSEADCPGLSSTITGVAFDPNGTSLAAGTVDGGVRVWNARSGKEIATHPASKRSTLALVFVGDDRVIFVTAGSKIEGTVTHWDLARREQVYARCTGLHQAVTAAAFTVDGATLAMAGADGTTGLWDTASGKPGRVLTGDKHRIDSLAFAPDGSLLAAGSADGHVHVWEVASGRRRTTIKSNEGPVLALAFSPAGDLLLAGGHDKTARLWKVPEQ